MVFMVMVSPKKSLSRTGRWHPQNLWNRCLLFRCFLLRNVAAPLVLNLGSWLGVETNWNPGNTWGFFISTGVIWRDFLRKKSSFQTFRSCPKSGGAEVVTELFPLDGWINLKGVPLHPKPPEPQRIFSSIHEPKDWFRLTITLPETNSSPPRGT